MKMAGKKVSRRDVLGAGAVGTGVLLTAGCRSETPVATSGTAPPASAAATPAQIEGPFYPIVDQADKDADLTRLGDSGAVADGEIVLVEGRVLDGAGAPIADAVVDIWQANAAGRYAHEADPNPAPLDPKFQGWAIMKTDAEGRYAFRTIRPGAYPAEADWWRPPHIHFKVARRGYTELTTQMYFEGEALNDADRLLQKLPENERPRVIARREDAASPFRFDIVLLKI
jgi:protocatechuate 3,4-dioxygenase, beta subunit